ncbi:ABC-type spermidine/putrescine transport system, permease component I [Neorhizobium galegae bv. officinalis bv. officinalis str. HAMBI 1141]|jgi:putative spermidine/putrescine transport system permease protein|uniref:Spermidine putrescine ABC transporter permease component PotB n=2 Tax=Neorhizobium galegae bv. officinalis TaxID=323656 RepID=A0A0T7FGN9_NEOGA|nr:MULTISPECIES: ABC transporter permease [Neorhizobium]CDN55640.1 ABC-type spermidine/putrescine transport system, permease component I [Neorhizobium galegae bv. officinalis bv. officinalis str. HAMBI 1141]CDZ34188.1 Spermidine putrescine ABC transporter permease component PotB [Neorhizobium galegae bv. officinalis]
MIVPPRKRFGPLLLIAPAAILLGVFLVLPYLNIVVMSFRMPGQGTPYGPGFTLGNYGKFFSDFFYVQQVINTLWIGFLTTFICLVLGYPVAWQLARGASTFRALGYALVLSPLLVGIVIRSYGWTILLGNNGIINRTLTGWGLIDGPLPLMYNALGIIIALVHVFLPFMILPIMSAIQGIDPSLEAAARSLGASKVTSFRRITLPLSLPGIQAGCILVFVLSLSAYVTPSLIGGLRVKTMAVTVVDALIDTFQWPFGSALALMLSVTGAIFVVIFGRLTVMKWKA